MTRNNTDVLYLISTTATYGADNVLNKQNVSSVPADW